VNVYAEHIEKDLGVEVRVHNRGVSGQTSGELLDRIRSSQRLRDNISHAEVITLWIGGNDMARPFSQLYAAGCGGTDGLECCRKPVRTLKANCNAILAEILSLRSTADTIIRIANVCNPFIAQ